MVIRGYTYFILHKFIRLFDLVIQSYTISLTFNMIFIVMGVSGSGKTTVGRLLANKLNLPFFDADDYHPPSNIEKMTLGIPLTDEDRFPWLKVLKDLLDQNSINGVVLACSALKESYREVLDCRNHKLVFLGGDYQTICDRMLARKNHFMSPDLLKSQFETLEKPDYGLHLDVSTDPDKLVNQILEKSKEK